MVRISNPTFLSNQKYDLRSNEKKLEAALNVLEIIRGLNQIYGALGPEHTLKQINVTIDSFLEEFKKSIDEKKCEGRCFSHRGDIRRVRVYDPRSFKDWGVFKYCETAIREDR